MDIIVIIGFCIAVAVICKTVENSGSEIKTLLILAAVTLAFLKIITSLSPIFAQIRDLFSQGDIDSRYVTILFKGLGICYITKLACDFCRDCGENALAGQAELAGKISLLIISLPLFSALIEIVKNLLM